MIYLLKVVIFPVHDVKLLVKWMFSSLHDHDHLHTACSMAKRNMEHREHHRKKCGDLHCLSHGLINTPWVVPWKQPIGWRPAPFLFSRKTLVGYIAISLLTRGYISYIPTQTYMLLGKKKQHHLVVTCTKTLSILHIQKGMFGTGSTYHQQWANKTPQHSKTNLVWSMFKGW